MSLLLHEQFSQLIARSKRPVIVLSATPTIDDFAAAFCIRTLCNKLDKPCDIVTSGGTAPIALKFLSTFAEVRDDFRNINALTLRVNVDHAKVDGLTYVMEGRELVITVTPKTGAWKNNDVRVACNDYAFDAVIAVGTPDRASLGGLQTTYADFFLRTPTAVIDHSAANEQFGTINLVELAATSVSEVVFDAFNHIDANLIDEPIATTLLAGMMSKTKSFRAQNVTPKTLEVMQRLMALGARRELVVEHLYRTRSVETLRLWGRALARLKSDETLNLVWTMVTRQDFIAAGATDEALRDIVDELLSSSPTAKIAIVFFENVDGTISARLHTDAAHDALILAAPFKPVGTKDVALLSLTEKDIVLAEKAVVTHVQQALR